MSTLVWVGPVFQLGGYGQVSRSYLLELLNRDVPVKVVPVDAVYNTADLTPEEADRIQAATQTEITGSPVVLVHTIPTGFFYGTHFPRRKLVGMTIFETDRIDPSWVQACNDVDQVIVPSEFNLGTFARSGVVPNKLRKVPYGIDVDRVDRLAAGAEEKQPGDPFTFLYVFAFGFRKGMDLLVEAYRQEFAADEPVRLMIKTWVHPSAGIRTSVREWAAAQWDLDSGPEIQILEGYTDHSEMWSLYKKADLYVSTDRANGWGMPCMEAMALGIPAATINWSGSTEFMTADNSLLIHPTGNLVPVDSRLQQYWHIYRGHQWAEVTVEEVRRVLRYAYEHPEELRRIGAAGRASLVGSIERAVDRLLGVISE